MLNSGCNGHVETNTLQSGLEHMENHLVVIHDKYTFHFIRIARRCELSSKVCATNPEKTQNRSLSPSKIALYL